MWDKVLCLEGPWKNKLRDRSSVLPMLELLERLRILEFVYRDVATEAELEHYLERWTSDPSVRNYYLLYLAFHGSEQGLELSGSSGSYSLMRLASVLEGACDSCVIHFGSCSIVNQPKENLDRFLAVTGAQAVTGYRFEVDWVDSAAMDIIILTALARHDDPAQAFADLRGKRYQSLVDELGFVMRTARR